MKVSFLLPPNLLPTQDWHKALQQGEVLQMPSGGATAPAQNLIYQSWFWLTQAGLSCDLVTQPPKEGIVIFISNYFSPQSVLSPQLFYVDVVADSLLLPNTHFHLMQNRAQAQLTPHSLFMPHWPQPNLIPRNPRRRSRFEKISFFGDLQNLATELKSPEWKGRLRRELGVFFDFKNSRHWHDYSDTDAVLAIRNFSRASHHHKPSTKLYNAWLAGVPFIGGRDSAYARDGRPGIDYLVATSPEQVIKHLRRLKENDLWRQQLVAHGHESAALFSRETTLARWRELVEKKLPTLAQQWQKKSSLQKSLFWMIQKHSYLFSKIFFDEHTK